MEREDVETVEWEQEDLGEQCLIEELVGTGYTINVSEKWFDGRSDVGYKEVGGGEDQPLGLTRF